MWYQFYLEQIHFSLNVFAFLIFFAVFWLYFDAWQARHRRVLSIRFTGYLVLSLSFLVHATRMESAMAHFSLFRGIAQPMLMTVGIIIGYILIIISLILDPIEDQPERTSVQFSFIALGPYFSSIAETGLLTFPILAGVIGWLLLKRATIGLEDHLKPLAIVFLLLAAKSVFGLAPLLRSTGNIDIYNLVAPFGIIWIIEHFLLLVAIIVLQRWVFAYLFKRFETQLFIIFASLTVCIYIITTVTFTGLLIKNIQDEVLSELSTNVRVIQYGVEMKKQETLSDAQLLAQNPVVVSALDQKSRIGISDVAAAFLLSKNQNMVVITNDAGQVIARGEDRERLGDALSNDPLVKRALLGETVSSIVTKEGVIAPEISVRSATPVRSGTKLVGVVMTGVRLDTAFVDGIKKGTGLESSLYADNQLSATTLTTNDGETRPIGIKENSGEIKNTVLQKGLSYVGGINFLNRPYFAAFLPMKDIDNTTVGMLFIGRPQVSVLQTAGKSIELTFFVAIIFIIIAVGLSYVVSQYLTNQMQ